MCLVGGACAKLFGGPPRKRGAGRQDVAPDALHQHVVYSAVYCFPLCLVDFAILGFADACICSRMCGDTFAYLAPLRAANVCWLCNAMCAQVDVMFTLQSTWLDDLDV